MVGPICLWSKTPEKDFEPGPAANCLEEFLDRPPIRVVADGCRLQAWLVVRKVGRIHATGSDAESSLDPWCSEDF